MVMAIGLRFRGRGTGKSLSPGSRAASRNSKNAGAQRPAGVSRRDGAAQWQRGQSTLGQNQQKASIFFGPAQAGGGKAASPASAMDLLTGRGSYMKEFGKQRKGIVRKYMGQKSSLLSQQRKQKSEIRRKLRKRDNDTYKEFKIASNLRPGSGDTESKQQRRLARKAGRKVMERVKAQQRDQLRGLRKQRDANIKAMVKELRAKGG